MSSRVEPLPAGARVRVAGGGSSRSWRSFDPHTGLDLARKLPDRQRCKLDELHGRLLHVELRLQTIADRHGEYV